jgi:hypothetical protein
MVIQNCLGLLSDLALLEKRINLLEEYIEKNNLTINGEELLVWLIANSQDH